MIKALESGPLGPAVVIGLTWRNLGKLAEGQPIRFGSAAVGWPGPPFEVLILAGASTAAIAAELAQVGLPVPQDAQDAAGLLSWSTFVHPFGRAAVLGVSAAADRALRDGAEITRRVPGVTPALRLIAAADTDRLAALITAGKPVLHAVDLRGGRTD